MAFKKVDQSFHRVNTDMLVAWRDIAPAVASDCMNRTQAMGATIKRLSGALPIVGQARTVAAMVGDCGSICELIDLMDAGDIIVIDAQGCEDTAVWGAMMTEAALYRGLAGAVINGAVRDIADIRKRQFPIYARAAVPRGPHHGFGGTIDCAIGFAGAVVKPGDIVIGDDDGIAVVPLDQADDILRRAQDHVAQEEDLLRRIRAGASIPELFGMRRSTDPSA